MVGTICLEAKGKIRDIPALGNIGIMDHIPQDIGGREMKRMARKGNVRE
jgi:hypothetical protein